MITRKPVFDHAIPEDDVCGHIGSDRGDCWCEPIKEEFWRPSENRFLIVWMHKKSNGNFTNPDLK